MKKRNKNVSNICSTSSFFLLVFLVGIDSVECAVHSGSDPIFISLMILPTWNELNKKYIFEITFQKFEKLTPMGYRIA